MVRIAFVMFIAIVAFTIGRAIAQDPYTYSCDGESVVVGAGESLWSLAQEHCEGHTGYAVHDLVNVYGEIINAGDIITLDGKRG